MKTIYVLAAILGLQFNTIFAAGNFSDSPASLNNSSSPATVIALAPVTPAEATFEAIPEMNENTKIITGLTPELPVVANFSDEAPSPEVSISTLAPVTPKEADFEEVTAITASLPVINLAPVTPAVADFEDHA
ncbi:MAG: hypothetical protein WCK34_06630 [Bacteroidota bacterium]